MLRKFIGEKIYCGLDLGSQKVKASLIKAVDPDCLELLGVYEAKTVGFKDSSVSNLGELTDCIRKTVAGLTKKAGVKIKDLQVGVGGNLVEKRLNNTVIPLLDRGSKVIGRHDIKKINNQARLLGVKVEEEILHDFSQYYRVDDVNTALNPVGLYGRKLEVSSLMIVSNITRLRNITKAVNQAGYEVANMFLTSYAAATVALAAQSKREGCVFVDIGSAVTDVLIFKNGLLQSLDVIHFGGDNITKGITRNLNLPFDLADEIKKSYALAIADDPMHQEEILVKRNSSYLPIKRKDIYESIRPEVEQFVQSLKEIIECPNSSGEINHGIVLVGGGALLSGLIERIEQETKMPTKLGKLRIGSRNLSHAAVFSSAVGLAKLGLNQSFIAIFPSNNHFNWSTHFMNRVKELYQEYF